MKDTLQIFQNDKVIVSSESKEFADKFITLISEEKFTSDITSVTLKNGKTRKAKIFTLIEESIIRNSFLFLHLHEGTKIIYFLD
jgi:hypothetical protein